MNHASYLQLVSIGLGLIVYSQSYSMEPQTNQAGTTATNQPTSWNLEQASQGEKDRFLLIAMMHGNTKVINDLIRLGARNCYEPTTKRLNSETESEGTDIQ